MQVALRVPAIASRIPVKCPVLLSAECGTARKRFVTVEDTCEQYPRSLRTIAAVDVLTGAVTDPGTRKALDTPASIELGQKLLRQAGERLRAAKAEIEQSCRIK